MIYNTKHFILFCLLYKQLGLGLGLGLGLVVFCLINVISYNKLESWNKFVLNDLSF